VVVEILVLRLFFPARKAGDELRRVVSGVSGPVGHSCILAGKIMFVCLVVTLRTYISISNYRPI